MVEKVACPGCGNRLQTDAANHGQMGRCPNCGQAFRLGDEWTSTPPPHPVPPKPATGPRWRRTPAWRWVRRAMLFGGAGFVILTVASIVLAIVVDGREPPKLMLDDLDAALATRGLYPRHKGVKQTNTLRGREFFVRRYTVDAALPARYDLRAYHDQGRVWGLCAVLPEGGVVASDELYEVTGGSDRQWTARVYNHIFYVRLALQDVTGVDIWDAAVQATWTRFPPKHPKPAPQDTTYAVLAGSWYIECIYWPGDASGNSVSTIIQDWEWAGR